MIIFQKIEFTYNLEIIFRTYQKLYISYLKFLMIHSYFLFDSQRYTHLNGSDNIGWVDNESNKMRLNQMHAHTVL